MKPFLARTTSQKDYQVENMTLDELLFAAEDEGISLAGCDTVEEMKECFVQGINRSKRRDETFSLWNEQRQLQLKEENEHKRNELAKIFNSTSVSLTPSLTLLNNILTQEGADKDLSRDIVDHMRVLQKGECNVLFAGETNAGKSTLLNLLLGVNVLPKSILSCTSGICKLSYSPTYTVVVVHTDGEEERTTFSDHRGTREFLEQTVASQVERVRELGPSFQEVHILLPANILKSGITIIDSPGFGENEAMDAVARDFVSNNDVAAFIYVIKTDNSGGVQEHRLIRFLKSILNIKKDQSDDSHYFNPKAALFVCNRWDQIGDKEKPKVRDHAINKLQGVWPGLEENQVCFLSSTAGRECDGWDPLQQSLDDIFQLARQVVITSSFCWLKHIVRECAFCLRTIVHHTNKQEKELQEKLSSATRKLSSLNSETRDTIERLKNDLQQDAQTFRRNLMDYLVSTTMKKELAQWEVEDIPEFQTFGDQYSARDKDEIIIERIVDILDASDITRHFIDGFVEDKMHRRVSNLGSHMDNITDELKDSTRNIRSSITSLEGFGMSSINKLVFRRLETQMTKTTPSGVVSFVELSKTVIKKAARAVAKMKQMVRRTSLLDGKNPFMLMTERAKMLAFIIAKDDEIVGNLVSRYTTRLAGEVDKIGLHVPKFVTGVQRLINEITSLRCETQIKRNDLQRTMERLEQQKEVLAGYGDLHVKNILPDDIMMYLDDPRLKRSSIVKVDIAENRPGCLSQVLWTRFQKGILSVDDVRESITVRYYINQPADNHLYREIAKLRCLEHFSVAKFLGMTHAESASAFIFLEDLSTAREYLRRPISDAMCTYRLKDAVPGLLEGLVEGLEYIHNDGLIHMELTVDTIMVNRSGEVKLVGMCLPRIAKFPLDRDTIQAGDFTCLSPEVLAGDVYTKEADIYSLGLFVAEIFLPDRPFMTQKTWALTRFMSSVNPSAMLEIPGPSYSKPLHELLVGCVILGQYQRLSVGAIHSLIQELKTDKLFESLGLTRRMNSRRPSALWAEPQDEENREIIYTR